MNLARQILDAPIGESFQRDDVGFFISPNGNSFIFNTARERLQKNPLDASKTLRNAFNEVLLWQPHFCGKEHEMEGKFREPADCPHHNNPLCGHPEDSLMYPVIALSGFIAKRIDTTIRHPADILNEISEVDESAGGLYSAVSLSAELGISPEQVGLPKNPQGSIRQMEKVLWEGVVKPYMMELSTVLRKINA